MCPRIDVKTSPTITGQLRQKDNVWPRCQGRYALFVQLEIKIDMQDLRIEYFYNCVCVSYFYNDVTLK